MLSEFLTHTVIIHIYSIMSSDIPQYIVVFAQCITLYIVFFRDILLCSNSSGRIHLNTLNSMLLSNVIELFIYTIKTIVR